MNPSLAYPDEGMTLDQLSNFVGEQLKRLNLVLKNLDGLNIVDIKFELQGGAYVHLNRKGFVISDGVKETFNVDIDGNLTMEGIIHALGGIIGGWTIGPTKLSGDGIIEGGTIRTGDPSTFPRVELKSSDQLLSAYRIATDFIKIHAAFTGSPTIEFDNGTANAVLSTSPNITVFNALLGDIQIIAQFGKVRFQNWSNIWSNGDGKTLQQTFDLKANGSGISGAFQTADGKIVSVNNGVITDIR